jgi:glycosyltransferase involved in cell wall biosynthesis
VKPKKLSKSNVLRFTETSHPLLEDIKTELEKNYDNVILYKFLPTKSLLRKLVKKFPFFIRHLKELIQFTEFIFENKKYSRSIPIKWYFLNLLYLLYLDKKYNFDIIDSHWAYPGGLIATFYAKYFPKRVVITVHGYDARKEDLEKKPELVPLILETLSKADYVLTAERKLFENLQSLGVKIVFTNQFVNLEEFEKSQIDVRKKLPISKNSFVVGFGPHLKEEYGIKDFVDAITLVKNNISNLFVICLGGGEFSEYAKSKFKENKIDFLIPGRIPREDFINHIKACDIVCIPGYITQGIFALEAFACSKPTIGYTDIHEIKIENNKTGILVKKGQIPDLAENIVNLYKNPTLRTQLGLQAYHKIETNYQKQKRIEEILEAFRKNDIL